MKKNRLFIATEIPRKITRQSEKIQSSLKKEGIKARWVNPDQVHLTLAFLGWTQAHKVKTIKQVVKKAGRIQPPLKLRFTKLNCFPSQKKARVIFVKLQGSTKQLIRLSSVIKQELKQKRIDCDRKTLTPHLTLGRSKNEQNLTRQLSKIKTKPEIFTVKNIILFKSQLTKSGPTYTPLLKTTLRG